MKVFNLISTLTVCFSSIYAATSDCEIDPHVEHAPLLISSTSDAFIYPQNGSETVSFSKNETVDLACPGNTINLEGEPTEKQIVRATCTSNSHFLVNDKEIHWRAITCSADPVVVVRKTKRSCWEQFTETDVGFQVDENRFVRTYSVCFDDINQNTLYSFYNLTPSIASAAKGVPRPNFYEDEDFYNVGRQNVNSLYLRYNQRKTINNLLGLPVGSTKYIKSGSLYYLARGHMTAKADFVYAAQQNTTFRYLNVAPQWQSFNGRNWEKVESSTRQFSVEHNVYLLVWTGTYDITTLPHAETGEAEKLYLYVDDKKRGIAVPAIYWKLIYNPVEKKGVVLIGENNPYEEDVAKHVICPDVSKKIDWVSWNKDSISEGYSYACEVEAFSKVVKYAPKVYVTELLV